MRRCIPPLLIVLLALSLAGRPATAEITTAAPARSTPNRTASLEELLCSRLRATRDEQKAFIRFVVKQTKSGRLDPRLVIAIQRKAVGHNRLFPFPYFERAMRFEAAKREVHLPPVRRFATTKLLPSNP
jgi:hypothetical protein